MCLAENVRLCIVASRNLLELYEKLTDIPFVTDDSRPIHACIFCCAKLKQCYRLLRQCLKAEKLFVQMMNKKYEPNTLINENRFEVFGGLIKSPVEHLDIVGHIAVREELSAVCEGPDDFIDTKEEYQSDELEPENLDNSCLDVSDIPPHCSESGLEDDVPLMKYKTEVEDEKVRARKTKKLEPEDLDNSCLDVSDIPPHCSESDFEDDVPLMKFKTEVEDEKVRARMIIKLEPENLDNTCLDVAGVPPHYSDADLEDDVVMNCKTEVEDENVLTKNRRAMVTIKVEPENFDNTCLNVAGLPPHYYDADLKDDVPVMNCKTEVDSRGKSKQRDITEFHAGEAAGGKLVFNKTNGPLPLYGATVVRKPKQNVRRTKEKDATTAEQTKNDKSDSNVNPTSLKGTYNPGTCFEEPYSCDRLSSNVLKTDYKCHVCQRSFIDKRYLTVHMRVHTGEKPYECNVCQRNFGLKSNLIIHMRTHTGEKPHKCNVCQRSFSRKNHLKVHMHTHTGDKPYKCNDCERSFTCNSHLKVHMLTHTGVKSHKCSICQCSFSYMSDLTRHMRTHTGEKPHTCNVCQRSFSRMSYLRQHMRTHTGEKPYECDLCQRKFSQKFNLTLHILTHSGEKPYKCDVCQRSYSCNAQLRKHILIKNHV